MQNNPKVAVEFLRRLYPEGPWTLTAIDTDRKGIETKTFIDADQDLTDWLNACHTAKRNVYYSVNRLLVKQGKKASREEIAQVCYLHVDVDPRVGENVDEEQERILTLLQESVPGVPPASIIVASGGGFNALWELDHPIDIGGDLNKAEDAKRYNQQLELLYKADHCHNIDRILRLPGTVNVPDAKKRRNGRVEVLATVTRDTRKTFSLSEFTPANLTQTTESVGFTNPAQVKVTVPAHVTRITVDELPDTVSDRCKMIIVQGRDPDDPLKFESRSEWLFYVCCELIRSGVEDDTIFSVITDPDFGISESVLDKGSSTQAYALRQIEQAHEHAINPKLREMNTRHAVIGNMGGRCRIIEEVVDRGLRRPRLTMQSFADFRNRYNHHKIEVGQNDEGKPIFKPLGNWWLDQPTRRQYNTITFAPDGDAGDAYNLWRGFACESRPGSCERFLHHLLDNVCSGNQEYYDYIVAWMARCVQQPDSPGQTAIVMRGKQGTGKSFVAKTFGSLWGRHFMQVSDPKHLVGSFNAHLRDCIVLFGDEAFFAGDKKHQSVLKMLITEELVIVEAKGVDAEPSPNYTHLMLASNDSWVIPAGADERRFLVLDVKDDHMQDSSYFQTIQDELESGGREALLHFLLTYDLSQFNVRHVPKTEALREQKLLSFTPEQEWWYTKLHDGKILQDGVWPVACVKDDVVDDYINYTQRVGSRRATATSLFRFLSKACPGPYPISKQQTRTVYTESGDKSRVRSWFVEFGGLDRCRAFWDAEFGGPYDWPEVLPSPEGEEEEPF